MIRGEHFHALCKLSVVLNLFHSFEPQKRLKQTAEIFLRALRLILGQT